MLPASACPPRQAHQRYRREPLRFDLAIAERNVERAIRRILGDDLWEAPEMADVTPAAVPEDRAMLLMSTQRRARSGKGVRFVKP